LPTPFSRPLPARNKFYLKGMAIKMNFVLFERTFKVIYEHPLQLFRTFNAWFSKYFDQKHFCVQSAMLVL
jgi:hypothetical protein